VNTFQNIFTIIGACVSVYFAIRVGATAVDAYKDWRSGWARWNSEKHRQNVSRLSLWSDALKVVKDCQDHGEYPYRDAVKIDLTEASPEDAQKLGRFKSPVDVMERQLELLFIRSGVADKTEVRRDGKLLYICSTSC